MTTNGSVGDALAAALARAEQLQRASARKMRVQIAARFNGEEAALIISARIATRHEGELVAQYNLGARRLAFADLDARASDLVGLVDAVVDEIEQAVANAPASPPRPSHGAARLDEEVFERFAEACAKALTEEATALLNSSIARTLPRGVAGEAVMRGALRLAALAAYSSEIALADATEDLREALNDVRRRAGERASTLLRARLDS